MARSRYLPAFAPFLPPHATPVVGGPWVPLRPDGTYNFLPRFEQAGGLFSPRQFVMRGGMTVGGVAVTSWVAGATAFGRVFAGGIAAVQHILASGGGGSAPSLDYSDPKNSQYALTLYLW